MDTQTLVHQLQRLKPKYESAGFTILGIFGSVARGSATIKSDIDILYSINDIQSYLLRYRGWDAVNHIVETKNELIKDLGNDIDFVDISTLSEIGKKYILHDLIYV